MPSPTLPTPPAGGGEEEDDAAASSSVSSPEAFSSISSEIPAAGGEDGAEVEPRKAGCEDGEEEELEEEDLICRRTRARYSLANFTLDELETFLQETDDKEDFQKADEEEEYQKFLAGFLAGEGESDAAGKEAEDENEVELEELLESDHEEVGKAEEEGDNVGAKGSSGRDRRRPNTRQNRCRQTLGCRGRSL